MEPICSQGFFKYLEDLTPWIFVSVSDQNSALSPLFGFGNLPDLFFISAFIIIFSNSVAAPGFCYVSLILA